MKKQKPEGRISRNISIDVKRMRNLLRVVEDEPKIHEQFLTKPKEMLSEFGIDLKRYASREVKEDFLVAEISKILNQVIEGSIMDRIRSLIDIYGATSFSSNTESSYEYNFDNSSSSDYKYESHTGTERGTFSETSTGSATDHDTTFRGFSPLKMREILQGPLINEVAVENILLQMEKTLDYAETKAKIK
jgi:hypothetical protein